MKKSHRILRDVSLVIVFCVGFLGLIGLANFLQDDSEEQTSSEFSEYRLGADEAAEGRDLDVSLQNLRALIKNDPFDGRAQFELASTLFTQVIEAQDSIAESNRNELQDQAESIQAESSQTSLDDQSLSVPPAAGPQAALDLNAEVDALLDQAIQEYKLAEKHPRYRLRSQIQLAVLLASKGDHEAALDQLEKFVNDGGATRRGLDQVEQFGSSLHRILGPTKLHSYPRFLYIVELEKQNRGGRGGFRSFESQALPLDSSEAPQASESRGFWGFLERLNNDLVTYRIKLVNFIRELFK